MILYRRWLFAAVVGLGGIPGATSAPLAAQQQPDTTFLRSYTVVFWVSGVRKSADFYHRLLGFPLVDYTVGQAKSVQTLSVADSEPYELPPSPLAARGSRFSVMSSRPSPRAFAS